MLFNCRAPGSAEFMPFRDKEKGRPSSFSSRFRRANWASSRCCSAMRCCSACSCARRRISSVMACCCRSASELSANKELINDVAAPCMKLLMIGFLVFITKARLTLLVSVSWEKLPVLETMAPEVAGDAAPSAEQVHGEDPPGMVALRAASHCAKVMPDWLFVPPPSPISEVHCALVQ